MRFYIRKISLIDFGYVRVRYELRRFTPNFRALFSINNMSLNVIFNPRFLSNMNNLMELNVNQL